MRYVAGQNVRWLWSVAVLLGAVRWAEAGPLDPNGFALSGTGIFPTLHGTRTRTHTRRRGQTCRESISGVGASFR